MAPDQISNMREMTELLYLCKKKNTHTNIKSRNKGLNNEKVETGDPVLNGMPWLSAHYCSGTAQTYWRSGQCFQSGASWCNWWTDAEVSSVQQRWGFWLRQCVVQVMEINVMAAIAILMLTIKASSDTGNKCYINECTKLFSVLEMCTFTDSCSSNRKDIFSVVPGIAITSPGTLVFCESRTA